MSETSGEKLAHYVRNLFAPEDALLQDIRAETRARGWPEISIRPEEGRILQLLLTAIGARRVIEIGTLAGYSAVWIARALPEGGRLITLERDPERAEVARTFFSRGGLSDRIEVRVGLARDLLEGLRTEGPFDAMFIDANKDDYPAYLAWAMEAVRTGGLIMAHNAFWGGRVIDPDYWSDKQVAGVLAFNRQLSDDPRSLATIIPVGDGLAAAIRLH